MTWALMMAIKMKEVHSRREKGERKELLEALSTEILEKIGDCKKEAAMKWWYTYRPVLISESEDVDGGKGQGPLDTILLASSQNVGRELRR